MDPPYRVKKYIYSELFFISNIFDHKKYCLVPKNLNWCKLVEIKVKLGRLGCW